MCDTKSSEILRYSKLGNEYNFDHLLIYDKTLKYISFIWKWISKFKLSLALSAGEDLKNIHDFPKHIESILTLYRKCPSNAAIVCMGGGSIGDFCGFIASILKRGIPFINIPSTWLAAIDSAHGGKNAINVPPFKNQLGTFYIAQKIYLIEDLLKTQPKDLSISAMGELWKIALIEGYDFWGRLYSCVNNEPSDIIWSLLEDAISAKLKVIKIDPHEKNKYRQVLNLGHSLGHVIESYHKLSHGRAVALGLEFAINFSVYKKFLSKKIANKIISVMKSTGYISEILPVPKADFLEIIEQDKKKSSAKGFVFIFLKEVGQPVREEVSFKEFVNEGVRQEWVK